MKQLTSTQFILLLAIQLVSGQAVAPSPVAPDSTDSDCTWYCDRIKAWRNYGTEYKATFYFESPISPKWIVYYTGLLGQCLSSGTLPAGETCTLDKLPTPNDPKCPANKVNKNGLCEECEEDEFIVDGKCVKKTLYGCKQGQQMVDGKCQDICKKPMAWVSGKCQKMCDKGYELKDGKCQRKCEKDQILTEGVCKKKNPCVKGEVLIAGMCKKICPKGQEPIGLKCKKINPCKPNEKLEKDGKCVKICPANYQLKNGECTKITTQCWTKKQCVGRFSRLQSKVSISMAQVNSEILALTDKTADDDWRRMQAAQVKEKVDGVYGKLTNDPRLVPLTQKKNSIRSYVQILW